MASWFNFLSTGESNPGNTVAVSVPTTEELPAIVSNNGILEVRRRREVWWERDKRIIEDIRSHPTTIEQAARKYFEGDYKKAAHCLHRLRRKGKIPNVSLVRLKYAGREQYQYSGWRVNSSLHEYYLTEVAHCYPEAEWTRGYKVNPDIRPDAEIVWGRKANVEMHLCTQKEGQVKERWKKYEDSQDPLLVVVHNPDDPLKTGVRVNEMMKWGEAVREIAFFIPFLEIQNDPLGAKWVDVTGAGITIGRILGTMA